MVSIIQRPYSFSTEKMPGQKQFMESLATWLLYSGSFGAGKSRVGCEKGFFLSLKYPNNFGAILRRNFASLRHTTMRTFFRDVCPESYLAKPYNKEEHLLTLKNGSQILFIGLDSDIKIGSLELGWAFVDEAIEVPEDVWIMLDGRVGRLPNIPFSQLMAATNPASNSHYLYRYFFDNPDDDSRQVIQANSLENPYLSPEYKEKLLKYTGRYKERYVEGKWVGYEGLVYDRVDVRQLVVEPFQFPADWPCYRAVDFGYRDPFVCQWWVEVPTKYEYNPEEPPEGEEPQLECRCSHKDSTPPYSLHHYTRCLNNKLLGFYMFLEIYMTQRLVEHHANGIQKQKAVDGAPLNILETIADHDAEGRATLNEHGVPTSPAKKRIANGIQTVTQFFEEDKIHIFEGCLIETDQSLVEAKKPSCTLQELGNYIWKQPRVVTAAVRKPEEPIDKDNHGMDTMRYLFHTLFGEDSDLGDSYWDSVGNMAPRNPVNEPLLYTSRDWGSMLPSSRNWRNS